MIGRLARAVRWLMWVVVFVLIATLSSVALIQTRTGKDLLASWVSRALESGTGMPFRIEGIHGFVPFDFAVDMATSGDTGDPWLRVEGFSFKWFPQALTARTIHIGRLEAAAVEILGLPPESVSRPEPGTSQRTWPMSIPRILMEHFSIERFFLDASVLGEEAEITAFGRMDVTAGGESVQGEFRILRLDTPGERAQLRWVLDTSPARLDLDFELMFPDAGIIPLVTGAKPGASNLRFSGEGPTDDWRGTLELETGAWGAVRCGIKADAALNRLSLDTEGDFEINEHLIQDVASLFPWIGSGAFSLVASLSEDGKAMIERFALTMDGMNVESSGLVDLPGRSGEIRLDLSVPEMGRFSSPILPVFEGSAHSRLVVRGDFDAPHAELTIEVAGLRAEGVETGFADAKFLIVPQKEGVPVFPEGLHVLGEGAVNDLLLTTGDRAVGGERIDWDIDMRLVSMDTLSLSRFRVNDGNLEADFSGLILLASRSLEGRIRVGVEDLADVPFLGESGIQGKASLSMLVHADGAGRSARADLQGRLHGIGPVPAELKAMARQGLEFRGNVGVSDGGVLRISQFRATGPGFGFVVDGSVDFVEEKGDISVSVAVPDAGAFSSVAGRSLGGAVQVNAGISGPLGEPRADVEVTIRDLEFDTVRVDRVHASLHVHDIHSDPKGMISIEVNHDDLDLRGSTHVSVETPFLELSEIRLEGVGALLSGELTLHVPSGTARGALNGTVENLAPVSELWGVDLKGRAEMGLRFHAVNDSQNMLLNLQVDDLYSLAGTAKKIEISGEALDVLGDVTAEVTASVTGFQHDGVSLERVSIKAGGGVDTFTFEAGASGLLKEPFRVSSKGVVRRPENMLLLNLESLAFEFGPHGLVLEAPSEMSFLPGVGVSTTPFVLVSDPGRLEIKGDMAERLNLTAAFEEIPLTLLALTGAPSMEGTVAGEIRISGTSQEPRVELRVTAEDVGLHDPALRHIPRFEISTNLSLGDGLITGGLTVDEGDSRPMEAFFTVPAHVSLSPVSAVFPEQEGIEGRLSAELDLTPLPLWLTLDGLRLSGRLTADVSVTGSLATPVVHGEARVRDGSCEVFKSGSVFRDVDALVRVSGEDLVLEHLRATDGNAGTMEMGGRLRPLPGESFPFEGRLEMNGFRLVRLDELTASAGAELSLSGTARKAEVSGLVSVASAEVRIPDRLPPRIIELEVIEVNGTRALRTPAGPEEADVVISETMVVDLNVEVDIPGRTYVRGMGLESEWRGALRVGGTAADPEISGDLSIVRGHYDFFGERFSLSSGNVILDGARPPQPIMNVTAERRKAGMTGRVILSGRPPNLNVEVTSEPPMPQDEVMSRLLFGRSLTTITPMQALRLASALDVLAGGKTFGFIDRAQRAIGADRLELVQPDDPDGSTALSLGRYVGDDTYVSVEKGLGTGEGRIIVEHELTPRISVQTEVGADSTGGVEVRWKWDY